MNSDRNVLKKAITRPVYQNNSLPTENESSTLYGRFLNALRRIPAAVRANRVQTDRDVARAEENAHSAARWLALSQNAAPNNAEKWTIGKMAAHRMQMIGLAGLDENVDQTPMSEPKAVSADQTNGLVSAPHAQAILRKLRFVRELFKRSPHFFRKTAR